MSSHSKQNHIFSLGRVKQWVWRKQLETSMWSHSPYKIITLVFVRVDQPVIKWSFPARWAQSGALPVGSQSPRRHSVTGAAPVLRASARTSCARPRDGPRRTSGLLLTSARHDWSRKARAEAKAAGIHRIRAAVRSYANQLIHRDPRKHSELEPSALVSTTARLLPRTRDVHTACWFAGVNVVLRRDLLTTLRALEISVRWK